MESEHFIGKVAQKAIIEKDGKALLVRDSRDLNVDTWDLRRPASFRGGTARGSAPGN